MPVEIPQPKGRTGDRSSEDEHPRADTRPRPLAKLSNSVRARKDGTVTAGNASGVNDGAAALVHCLARRRRESHGLEPLARTSGAASAGVPPRIMGIGPAPADGKLCERLGLKPTDFDAVELNEAFASQGTGRPCATSAIPGGRAARQPERRGHRPRPPSGMSGARITGSCGPLELARPLRQAGSASPPCASGVGQGISVALAAAG